MGDMYGQQEIGSYDAFIVKYNSTGTRLWARLSGVSSAQTKAEDIATDANDNVYITGYTQGQLDRQTLTGTEDAFIIKYNSIGSKQWTRLIGNPDDSTQGYGIALDSNNIAHSTGESLPELGGVIGGGTYNAFITTELNF